MTPQVLESMSFFHGSILVTAQIFLTCAGLSDRIYKICTPLSTGFVENIGRAGGAPPRKPWPDADFRGTGRPSL
jgi:hypothetical protein